MKNRILKDIPDLVKTLTEKRKLYRDVVSPSSKITAVSKEGKLSLSVDDGLYDIQHQVHGQLAEKTSVFSKYYNRLLDGKHSDLLAHNLNYWFKEMKSKHLVRFEELSVRAFLSDKYRPIDHLDVLTTAVQVVVGKDGVNGEEKPHARGARCFAWNLSPTNLDVCFVNPGIVIDLNNLDKGVQNGFVENKIGEGGGTSFVFPGKTSEHDKVIYDWGNRPKPPDGTHPVFPAARIRNSETGHGGISVQPGLYEAVCDNTCWTGMNFSQRHLGKALEMDEVLSSSTYEKMNSVIYSKIADITRSVFDPEILITTVKKFKDLQEAEINVKEALDNIVKLPGITEEIRDDILSCYKPVSNKDTAFDFQRAITSSAHASRNRNKEEQAYFLEELGGEMLDKGMDALILKI